MISFTEVICITRNCDRRGVWQCGQRHGRL